MKQTIIASTCENFHTTNYNNPVKIKAARTGSFCFNVFPDKLIND